MIRGFRRSPRPLRLRPLPALLALALTFAALSARADEGWIPIGGPPVATATALAINPSLPYRLYTADGAGGIWMTTRAGENWSQNGPTLRTVFAPRGLSVLEVDPARGTNQWAGVRSPAPGVATVYRHGLSHPEFRRPLAAGRGAPFGGAASVDLRCPAAGHDLRRLPLRLVEDGGRRRALAGPLLEAPRRPRGDLLPRAPPRSGSVDALRADGGSSWFLAGHNFPPIEALRIDPTLAGTLYLATQGHGILKSTDFAASFWPASLHLGGDPVSLTARGTRPAELWTTMGSPFDRAVARSRDGGATWAPLPIFATTPIALDPSRPGMAFAGALDSILKTTDGGAAWRPLQLPCAVLANVVTDPRVESSVYAFSEPSRCHGGEGILFRSVDGGRSFTIHTDPTDNNYTLVFDPETPNTLYALSGATIRKSTNGGLTWHGAARGLTISTSLEGLAASADPARGGGTPTLYAGDLEGQIFRSTDAAATWQERGTTPARAGRVAVDPRDAATLYTWGDVGVFRSTDGGITWTLLPSNLWGDAPRGVVAVPADPSGGEEGEAAIYAFSSGGLLRLR